MATIEYDCQQTAPCDPEFAVHADPVNECIRDTGEKLNIASDGYRAMYEMRAARCAQYTGCTYYACAGDANLFSIVHMAQLQYECQQTNLCKVMRGEPTLPTDNDTCFTALANRLDFASQPDKAAWEQKFTRCQTQVACNYVMCQ